jgi:hypothetical protein
MSNRFEHLKNKPKAESSMLDFIDSANKDVNTRIANKQVSTKQILLSISGKMDREKECMKPVLLHLKRDISVDIEKYCHGNKQAILNYLIRKGLDSLIEKGELELVTE